jgi:streptomycin 6-kinase
MFQVPAALKWMEKSASGRDWLRELPVRVNACCKKWSLQRQEPYPESYVSIVFPAKRADGSSAVLKIQFPHGESEHEAEALRVWNGKGAVQLFDFDPEKHALLLEQCAPGTHLSKIGVDTALEVLTELLPRLWVRAGKPFRLLADEATTWMRELPGKWERAGRPFERALLDAALEAIGHLHDTQGEQVLVHQDLHGDNVLRAQREPWLVIDPKPLLGEKELSLAPIIRGYEFGHSRPEVIHRLDWLTSELRLDRERTRLWTLAQTLAWAFEGDLVYDKHVETARWLWQA